MCDGADFFNAFDGVATKGTAAAAAAGFDFLWRDLMILLLVEGGADLFLLPEIPVEMIRGVRLSSTTSSMDKSMGLEDAE